MYVLGVVYVVWGSTYLAIRYLVGSLPPLLGAGLRFVIAGPLLALLVLSFAGRSAFRMSRSQLASAALVGLLLAGGGQGMLTVAETQVASGLAALLVACVPLYVILLRRLTGERPPLVTLLGVGIGLAGLVVLLSGGAGGGGAHGSEWWGPWLVLLGALIAGERFGWVQLAGGALVLVAVIVVMRAEQRTRRARHHGRHNSGHSHDHRRAASVGPGWKHA
ncbi:MAG: EamA family transporter [Pseudonocardiaceae bacterium]|nr:EamA family transporter [Pseudonocardiaceae bacterium]